MFKNKFNIISFFTILTLILIINPFNSFANDLPKVNTDILINDGIKNYPQIKWVTLQNIKDSLNKTKPIAIGFDIDDTILFSSPCFYRLENQIIKKYKLENLSLEGKKDSDFYQYIAKDPDFFNKWAKCDVYSLPKHSVLDIIHMHQTRGDQIYFITARREPSTARLRRIQNLILFKLVGSDKGLHSIINANTSNKTDFIKKYNIKIYYGDADSDIKSAQNAGARGIRILRASNSTNQPLPFVGSLGEEVLVNSQK